MSEKQTFFIFQPTDILKAVVVELPDEGLHSSMAEVFG